jgi:hypothetical protein
MRSRTPLKSEDLVMFSKCSHGRRWSSSHFAEVALNWTYVARSEGFEPPTF